MSTIRDVAQKANVSIATVSRYLNAPEKVAKKSAEDVANAIRQLNYKPNLLARNFFKSRSYAVLVLVPNIANPFFSRVIRGIEDIGQQKGYAVLLATLGYQRNVKLNTFSVSKRARQRVLSSSVPTFPVIYQTLNQKFPL